MQSLQRIPGALEYAQGADALDLREEGQRRAVLENMLRRRQIPADSPLAGAMARAMDCRLDQAGA